MVEAVDRTPRLSRAPVCLSILVVNFVSRHGSVPLFPPPTHLHYPFASAPPSLLPAIPFPFYYPQICRIRHSLLVMFLYHYSIAQMFCGSPCMSYLGATLRNIYCGGPLDWRQRPHGHCITFRDVYVFAETVFIGHFVLLPEN